MFKKIMKIAPNNNHSRFLVTEVCIVWFLIYRTVKNNENTVDEDTEIIEIFIL